MGRTDQRWQQQASFTLQSLSPKPAKVVSHRLFFGTAQASTEVKGHKMALASHVFPRLLLSRPWLGGAARFRTPGAAEVRPSLAGLCCLCRRHLGSGTTPFPRVTLSSAASTLPARGPRRPLLSPPGLSAVLPAFPACPRRSYSTEEQPQQRQKTKMIILGFSNPINWIRTRIYAFLIWAYFDQEFSIAEFSEGAKQVCLLSWG